MEKQYKDMNPVERNKFAVDLYRQFAKDNAEYIALIQTSNSVDELRALRLGFQNQLEESKIKYPGLARMDIPIYTSEITRRIIALT